MVMLISLPPFLSPLVALMMALFGALAVSGSRRKTFNTDAPDDVEQRILALTRKVRRRATVRSWLR
jgi:hypothetical protein